MISYYKIRFKIWEFKKFLKYQKFFFSRNFQSNKLKKNKKTLRI